VTSWLISALPTGSCVCFESDEALYLRRFALIRHRLGVLLALVATMVLAGPTRDARAAAEIHKLNLTLSAIPTQIDGGDFNDTVDFINRTGLRPFGLEGLDRVTFGFLFDAEVRYFVRPNVAVSAGVGQLKAQTKREFLPALQQSIALRGEVLTVPVHIGATYYFTPYNQGDFQARAFLGGGALSLVYNKSTFEQVTNFAGPPNFKIVGTQDAPGYYLETGVHMFFAASYSVILSGQYRSAVIRNLIDQDTGNPTYNPEGQPFSLDMSGVGARLGVCIGF
jgi:hypothetical protein